MLPGMNVNKNRSLLYGLSFSFVFVLGCVASQIASTFVVPPARAGTNPTRWEYHCFAGNASTEYFNKLGQQGWELAGAAGAGAGAGNSFDKELQLQWCFKRQLP
jgi:hypothetical protein